MGTACIGGMRRVAFSVGAASGANVALRNGHRSWLRRPGRKPFRHRLRHPPQNPSIRDRVRGLPKPGAFALLMCLVLAAPAQAHEVRPGYLELREQTPTRFSVLWRVPARGDARLRLYARLPDHCRTTGETLGFLARGAHTERWSIECAGGLVDAVIRIDGLATSLTDVLARVEWADGASQVERLTPDRVAFVVRAAPQWFEISGAYLALGVEHILTGVDHLLFVLCLLILVDGWRRLVATITAFTVAHSLTLGAATLGLATVAQAPVEAVIALSIVFVAGEIVHGARGRPGLTGRAPWAIAFIFGLLHGFGFAGALLQAGLPDNAVPLALLFFNLGVEVGQLAFVALVLVAMQAWRRLPVAAPAWASAAVAYLVGSVAMYWTIERTLG